MLCAIQFLSASKNFAQQLSLHVTWKANADAGALAFSDSETLLSGGKTINCYPRTCGQVKTWHFKDSVLLNTFSNYFFGLVNEIKPSAKTKTYLTANGSSYCEGESGCYIDRPGVYNINLNGKQDTAFNPGGNAYSIGRSPDETTIAVGTGYNNTGDIMIYDKNYKLLRTLDGHQYNTTSVVFIPNGKLLISGGYDGLIKFWNYKTGALLKTLIHGDYLNGGNSLKLSVSPDGKFIASTGIGYNLVIKIWRIADGALINTIPLNVGIYGSAVVQYSPDGKYLACATVAYKSGKTGYTGNIYFYTTTGSKVLSYSDGDGSPTIGGIKSIAFSPDSKYIAYGLNNSTFKVAQIINTQNAIASSGENIIEAGNAIIVNTRLFPNPVKEVATLQFSLNKNSKVEIALYSADGRRLKTISNELRNAGIQNMNIDASAFAPGIYFISLQSDECGRIMKLYKY